MSFYSSDERIVKTAVELLSVLINPVDKGSEGKDGSVRDFDEELSCRLYSESFSNAYENLIKLSSSEEQSTWPISNIKSRTRWKFICTNMHLMKIIHDVFVRSTDEKVKLLSFSQKKILEASFEFVISIGVLQNLLPGVGVPLDCKSKNVRKITPENLTEFAKYRRLCQVMDDVIFLFNSDIFHDLIVSKHLDDVLAGLFQLAYAPLKKPNDLKDKSSADFNSFSDDFELKDMSFSVWKKLEENKKKFNDYVVNLLQKIYKPLLIRKFSLLLSSKNIPKWLKQKLTKFLSDMLKENNGVVIMIKTLVDGEVMTPAQSSQSVSVAKLISYECLNDVTHIVPQLLKILESERKQPEDLLLVQVAALTINNIFSQNPVFAEEHFFIKMYKPFNSLELATEEEICIAVHQLFNLFIIPNNDIFSIPIRMILPTCQILFHMHCRIKDSVCYLKSYVKEILLRLVSQIDKDSFAVVMNCFIFKAQSDNIFRMPLNKSFALSSSGGICLLDCENATLEMENAFVLLNLVKATPDNEKVVRSLFSYLLKMFISEDKDDEFKEKRLIISVLLAEMSQCPETLCHILLESESIIKFVGDLLSADVETTENDDVICISFTFLTMVLYDSKKKKNLKWDVFDSLLGIVEKYKLHPTTEVKFLAEEVCNLIRTRGVIGNVETSEGPKKAPLIEDIIPSYCERCIEEACDPLLPVRAHALMELICLIKKGDPETLAKKEKIYCLFEENLKNEDSFLYLRAVEGLSCMAILKPDAVLPLLCQEFISCSNSTTQLKIGEVLVRATKSLHDFIHPHKKLLVCTFMNGVKSEDSLIRASSLSNLAEICLALQRNVEDLLYEVLFCALSVAQCDKEIEPRRAAVLLICSLFGGLKSYIFTVLESHLLDLYHTLKRIQSVDTDEVVRLQAARSLDILNENTREFLWAKPKLEKKIHIIRPV